MKSTRLTKLVILFVLAFSVTAARGQNTPSIQCSFTPETPTRVLRWELNREEVGEPEFNCTLSGLTPGQQPPWVNFRVGLDVNITSRMIGNRGYTEAFLYTKGTTPANTRICAGSEAPVMDLGCPGANTWSGKRLGNNWLQFSKILFPPPSAGQTTSQQAFQITGVRAAASQAGTEIRMTIGASFGREELNPVQLGGPIVVARAQKSLKFKFSGYHGTGGPLNPELLNARGPVPVTTIPEERRIRLEWQPQFAGVFRKDENRDDDDAGSAPRRIDKVAEQFRLEDQFRIETHFQPDQGTRLMARFSNLPPGARSFASSTCASPSQETELEALDYLAALIFPAEFFEGNEDAVWRIRKAGERLESLFCAAALAQDIQNLAARGFAFAGYGHDFIRGTNVSVDLSGSYYLNRGDVETKLEFDNVQSDREPFLFYESLGPTVQWTFVLPTGSRTPTIQQGAIYPPFDYFSYIYNVTQTGPTSVGVSNATLQAGNTPRQATVNWLTAELLGAQTPAPIAVSFNPAGLGPGVYDGSISLGRAGLTPISIPIVLTITPPGPSFSPWGFSNAGSYANKVVAPGEAVVIFGQRFGPPSLATAQLGQDGRLSARIGETRVLFDGEPAPMIYAVNGQVSCLVPFGLAGKLAVSVQVEYQGVLSPAIRLPVAPAVPALLTADSSGFGQAAALNQDNSFNSVRGEAPGNYVSFFGVGAPNTTPGGVDGAITRAPFPRFTGPAKILFDGEDVPAADVAYLGPAPEQVNGVFQATVRTPSTARPGSRIEVRVQFGDYITQPSVFFTVR